MNIYFSPSDKTSEVCSIENHHKKIPQAEPLDAIGFNIKNLKAKDIKRGDVCGELKNDPPREALSFIGLIIVLNNYIKILKGYQPVVKCHCAWIKCKIEEIIGVVDKKNGKEIEKNPEYLKNGDHALVKFVPMKPMCVETFEDYPNLGKFVILDMKQIIGVGKIKSVEKKEK